MYSFGFSISNGKSAASCNLPHFEFDSWFSIPNSRKKCGKLQQLAAL
jgi:hypothetical protein